MTDSLALLIAVIVLTAIPLLVWVIRRIREDLWKERARLGNLGALSDAQFDDWVESLFVDLGYRIEQARGRESLGVDWILTDPRGHRTALQTRRWRQDIGPEAVEQIVGGAVFHRCDERLMVTTATFTGEAKRLGRQTGTRLWGMRELAGAMEAARKGVSLSLTRREPAPSQGELEPAEMRAPTAPSPTTPTPTTPLNRAVDLVASANQPEATLRCPRCGKTMVRRSVNGRPVMVCLEFPRCTGARAVESDR